MMKTGTSKNLTRPKMHDQSTPKMHTFVLCAPWLISQGRQWYVMDPWPTGKTHTVACVVEMLQQKSSTAVSSFNNTISHRGGS